MRIYDHCHYLSSCSLLSRIPKENERDLVKLKPGISMFSDQIMMIIRIAMRIGAGDRKPHLKKDMDVITRSMRKDLD